jgi:hypothetical protein
MNGADAVPSHGMRDMELLSQLWTSGVPLGDIAARFGVAHSTVVKWAKRYGLPRRTSHPNAEPEAPSPEDEAVSSSGLELAPWVAERARECRERHYAERRAEAACNTFSKVAKWRAGTCLPR